MKICALKRLLTLITISSISFAVLAEEPATELPVIKVQGDFLNHISEAEIQTFPGNRTIIRLDAMKEKGDDFELTSKHVGLVGIEYLLDNSSFFIETYGQSSQFTDSKNTEEESTDGGTGKIPGFGITNIGASYNPVNLFSVSGGIKNILDKEYFSRSRDSLGRGKYLEQPRTAYVSGGFNF